jgi:hypothetical protein
MKKFKLKNFVIIFFITMLIQFLIGLADVLLSQANNELSSITSILLTICSLPISLINRDLPFFVSENIMMVVLYWGINLFIQTVFVYSVLIVVKKIKSRD